MDQGLVRCLETHYRKRLVKLILGSLDCNKPLPKLSLLTALQLLISAWNEVSQTTIVNCFKKADEEILQEATQTENDKIEEIEDDEEELVAPSKRDVENSLDILKNLALFSEKRGDQMQDLINKFETL